MVKLKVKPLSQTRPKSRKRTQVKKKTAQKDSTLDVWREEVKGLMGKRYESVEQAITALINRVLNRLEIREGENGPTRRFLEDLLLTDPTLKGELQKVLKVR